MLSSFLRQASRRPFPILNTRLAAFSTSGDVSDVMSASLRKGFDKKQAESAAQSEERKAGENTAPSTATVETPVSSSSPPMNWLKDQSMAAASSHSEDLSPKIVVIGVGGAGGNAVNNMIARGLRGVEFLACNTDAQHLETTLTKNRVQLGPELTGGLGCGAFPEKGRKSAELAIDEVLDHVADANMVFITAGMGGGTGTGAAPVIARACMEAGILTVAVVTKPFSFEGGHRSKLADAGLNELRQNTDTMIVIPNQNLFKMSDENTSLMEAFSMADDVLLAGVKNITDLMVMPGLINLDFADVQSVMNGKGNAMMGVGEAEGEGRALKAAEIALCNPLLGQLAISSAKGMLVNITGGADMTLFEVDAAAARVTEEVEDPMANIIFGSTYNNDMEGKIRVSIVATGINDAQSSSGIAANSNSNSSSNSNSHTNASRVSSM